jgi:pimeloyl-ACP methyl ester carboxylesterase
VATDERPQPGEVLFVAGRLSHRARLWRTTPRTIDPMPRLRRPDGAEIEWWIDGAEGPLVAIALMALQPPGVCGRIVEQLAGDHRVLGYHLRGTGASSMVGPYDIETDAADLAALIEEAGGDALVIAVGDGARRSVRAAAERPDLIHTVVVSGELPLGKIGEAGSQDALANSPAVLDALLGLLATDYRTGLRTMMTSSGEGAWQGRAMQERLDATEAHSPPEVGVPRMRSWIEDDSRMQGRALGDRLWYLHYPGNAWFQGSIEIVRRSLPEARLETVSEGVISSPEENAKMIRRILAARRAAA